MHNPWSVYESVYESAPVPDSDAYDVTNGYDHRCLPFPVHGKLDEVGIFGKQHHVGGNPAAGRWRVRAQTRCPRSPRPIGFRSKAEV